jgi:hypothetical protein
MSPLRRYDQASERINAAYCRLDSHGPWQSDELPNAHPLAKAMDLEAKHDMAGETAEPTPFLSALARWEHALVATKGGIESIVNMGER